MIRVNSARASGSASAAAATLPISSRADASGSSSRPRVGRALGRHPQATPPRSPRRVRSTSSCVSQRRSCRPSLVPGRGSATASGPARSAASRASTSSTRTVTPPTVAATALTGPSPSPRASRAAARRSRPEPAPTTRRGRPTRAAQRRIPARRCPPAGSVAPTAAGPIHSQVPHGLIRCASTARSARASVPTVDCADARIRRRLTTTASGPADQRASTSRSPLGRADGHQADVLDHLPPRGRHRAASLPVTASSARTGYRPVGVLRGTATSTSVSRYSPGGSTNDSSAGLAAQPSGHTSRTLPCSAASLQSLAAVSRSTPQKPGSADNAAVDAGARRQAARPAARARGCATSIVRKAVAPLRHPARARQWSASSTFGRFSWVEHGGDLESVQRQTDRSRVRCSKRLLQQVDARCRTRLCAALTGSRPRVDCAPHDFRRAGPPLPSAGRRRRSATAGQRIASGLERRQAPPSLRVRSRADDPKDGKPPAVSPPPCTAEQRLRELGTARRASPRSRQSPSPDTSA